LRLIGISARSAGDEAAQCRAAGMNDFVRKPVSGAMLAEALRTPAVAGDADARSTTHSTAGES
jgi:CheY-like chemotaxis protein